MAEVSIGERSARILLRLLALCICHWFCSSGRQLVLQSETKYFSRGSIIADSREAATGLMVITSGQVGVELPMDSDEADEENCTPGGNTQLYVFSRGSAANFFPRASRFCISVTKRQGLHWGERCCWRPEVGWDVRCWSRLRGADSLLRWDYSHWRYQGAYPILQQSSRLSTPSHTLPPSSSLKLLDVIRSKVLDFYA